MIPKEYQKSNLPGTYPNDGQLDYFRIADNPRRMVIKTEREEGDRVRLTVKDAGVGLGPRAMDRLFEAFYTT
jgi:nitrogen fixation/metabolism regulation signal transduction histidine kinase